MQITFLYRQAILTSIFILFVVLLSQTVNASEFSMISTNHLKLILDNPEVVIIDVRGTKGWQSSNVKIKGAIRKAPQNFESWVGDFPKDKTLVLY